MQKVRQQELTVDSRSGMVATTQPLAVEAGIAVLDAGGTAADAAVAAAATLCVVEPRATGVGGDAFALYWPPSASTPIGLDGAGPSAAAASPAAVRAAGHTEMPATGPWTVTVPGAVDAWLTLLARFGRLDIADVLAPAIRVAREGFAVTPVIAAEWAMHAHRIEDDPAARDVFLPDGRAPRAGEVFHNRDLGRLLQALASHGREAFYEGETAQLIGQAVQAAGGPLSSEDLELWSGARWVEPLVTSFRGASVIELPPPGQGIVALEALGIFARTPASGLFGEEHYALEAIKLAFADAGAHLADPLVETVPVDRLLSDTHLRSRADEITQHSRYVSAPGPPTDTVYVAAVDAEGGACSLIQSLYSGFGSGIGVAGLGITLQNRGKGFVLDEGHPNQLAPRKRPYHTIIPAMLARDGTFLACLGVVGGFMQPQGQMQIIRHLLDHEMTVGQALAAPRLRFLDGHAVGAEPGYDPDVLEQLRSRGHEIGELSNFGAGGAQLLLRDGSRLMGASDPRKDGCVLSTSAAPKPELSKETEP
jgi:gamma-glutamyltranspeptidase/glutathione hydrolase